MSANRTQLLVLGGGPGGYTAAFRAADLGLEVTLVEREPHLGGVCLNVGCIPSKALLHAAKIITDAEHAQQLGISYPAPTIDLEQLRASTQKTVRGLTSGLSSLAKTRGVKVIHATGTITSPTTIDLDGETLTFEHAILATGSLSTPLPGAPQGDPRVMSSTEALALPDVPEQLLVLGGGIIGLELATVYDALGSRVTVVENAEQLIPEADPDLIAPLARRIEQRYQAIHLDTRLETLAADQDGLHATLASASGGDPTETIRFDRALIAIGRTPNTTALGLDAAGIDTEASGRVRVDGQLRTSVPHIHAIGDLTPGPMLAHKATHQAKLAAEIIAGANITFDARAIPAVAYTEPEIAWSGLTEKTATEQGIDYRAVQFPWTASGRAQTAGTTGLTKLIVSPSENRLLGAGIVGANAGELIAGPTLALELAADAQDIALTVHPHPTLAETVALAAEIAEGTITDLPPRRRATKQPVSA